MTTKSQQYKRPESVLVVVYTRSNEVLALRRKYPDYFWQSVAGSLERAETPQQAARRELSEESGLSARQRLVDWRVCNEFLIYPLWQQRYAPGIISNKEHLFSLALEAPCDIILDAREHSEYRWLSPKEAIARITSHTNRGAIQQLIDRGELHNR